MSQMTVWALEGIGEVRDGDDLGLLISQNAAGTLEDGDILIVTSKVVSKAEGRHALAQDRDAAIQAETIRVVATRTSSTGHVTRIVENRQGIIGAAAGVDASNVPEGRVLLLPSDPDASARQIATAVRRHTGAAVGVIISDTLGRPWRDGQTDIAIGAAGVKVFEDLQDTEDAEGRPLTVTKPCIADELAGAGDLVKGKISRRPVAVIRGMSHLVGSMDLPGARSILRDPVTDLFRVGAAEAFAEGRASILRGGSIRHAEADSNIKWTVVIPVKQAARAKTRLVPPGGINRGRLALAFALDTITAALAVPSVARVVVVTDEPALRDVLPSEVEQISDPSTAGLNAAIAHGIASVRREGSGAIAILLGDLPAVRPVELHEALSEAAMVPRAIVTDTEGNGTSLLTANEYVSIRPEFGTLSASAHTAQGHVRLDATTWPGLTRDVDDADAFNAAIQLGVGSNTAALLVESDQGQHKNLLQNNVDELNSYNSVLRGDRNMVLPMSES